MFCFYEPKTNQSMWEIFYFSKRNLQKSVTMSNAKLHASVTRSRPTQLCMPYHSKEAWFRSCQICILLSFFVEEPTSWAKMWCSSTLLLFVMVLVLHDLFLKFCKKILLQFVEHVGRVASRVCAFVMASGLGLLIQFGISCAILDSQVVVLLIVNCRFNVSTITPRFNLGSGRV